MTVPNWTNESQGRQPMFTCGRLLDIMKPEASQLNDPLGSDGGLSSAEGRCETITGRNSEMRGPIASQVMAEHAEKVPGACRYFSGWL